MYGKKYCLNLIKMYYSKGSPDFPERGSVRLALDSADPFFREECDRIFSYFFENGRRNVNAVSIEFFISPSSVYRRLDKLSALVSDELDRVKKYTTVTLKST